MKDKIKKPCGQFYRMSCRVKLYIGGDKDIVADGDPVAVHKGTVHIDFTMIAKVNIIAVVRIKRCGNPQIFPLSAELGAGSVVTKDIPDNTIAYGNPCHVMRENK